MKTKFITILLIAFLAGCSEEVNYIVRKDESGTDLAQKQAIYECRLVANRETKNACVTIQGWALIPCHDESRKMFDTIMKECLESKGYSVSKE
jgi:hypothetical protein